MSNHLKTYVAKTMFGLEHLVEQELKELGISKTKIVKRAVEFEATKKQLYQANYQLRCAVNILEPIHSFEASTEDEFYKKVKSFPWFRIMKVSDTFAISHSVNSPNFTHSYYITLKMKDAIVDRFREERGKRPSIDTKSPSVKFNLRINGTKCYISIDTSGNSLFKRGYREYTNDAPLNEILAASLIKLMNLKKEDGVMDITCGTGTIPIETGFQQNNIPSGYYRSHFGFMTTKGFDPTLWDEVKKEANRAILESNNKIYGTDLEAKFIRLARKNADQATLLKRQLRFTVDNATLVKKPMGVNTVIINPPYGERLLDQEDTIRLYKNIDKNLQANFKGCRVGVLSSNIQALDEFTITQQNEFDIKNGDLDCKFRIYQV